MHRQVAERVLSCGRAVAAPLLQPILAKLTGAFEARQHAACLQALGTAVVEFGDSKDEAEAAAIGSAFCRACAAAAPLLQARVCMPLRVHACLTSSLRRSPLLAGSPALLARRALPL
jgi:hypothetical protein